MLRSFFSNSLSSKSWIPTFSIFKKKEPLRTRNVGARYFNALSPDHSTSAFQTNVPPSNHHILPKLDISLETNILDNVEEWLNKGKLSGGKLGGEQKTDSSYVSLKLVDSETQLSFQETDKARRILNRLWKKEVEKEGEDIPRELQGLDLQNLSPKCVLEVIDKNRKRVQFYKNHAKARGLTFEEASQIFALYKQYKESLALTLDQAAEIANFSKKFQLTPEQAVEEVVSFSKCTLTLERAIDMAYFSKRYRLAPHEAVETVVSFSEQHKLTPNQAIEIAGFDGKHNLTLDEALEVAELSKKYNITLERAFQLNKFHKERILSGLN